MFFFGGLFDIVFHTGTPHEGMSKGIVKMKSKSLRLNLLEQVAVHNGTETSYEVKLNLYRMTCDSSTERDQLEVALRNLK